MKIRVTVQIVYGCEIVTPTWLNLMPKILILKGKRETFFHYLLRMKHGDLPQRGLFGSI